MDNRVDEVTTPADAGVPRRFAVQSIVGSIAGLAGLAGLGAADADAQARKKAAKKAAKKKTPKKKAAKKTTKQQRIGAQAPTSGQITRVRQVIDSVNIPVNSNRVLNLVCPRPQSNERVAVVGGGYNLAGANAIDINFVVKTSAPSSATSWLVDGHNRAASNGAVTMGGYAVCLYYRR